MAQYIGMIYAKDKQYHNSISFYELSYDSYKAVGSERSTKCGQVAHRIALLYDEQKKTDQALQYYLKSLAIYRSLQDKNIEEGDILHDLGLHHYYNHKYNEALDYFKKGQEVFEEVEGKDSLSLPTLFENMGRTYKQLNNH